MRRYIASDLHNGNTMTDYDRVMSFLDLVDDDADKFLIIGDFLELLWSNINIITGVEPYKSTLERVRQIAQRKSVDYVLGNHDWSAGMFESLLAPIKVTQPFSENGVFYTHGHNFSWYSFNIGTPFDPVYWRKMSPFVLPQVAFISLINEWLGFYEDAYSWAIAMVHEDAAKYARKNGYNSVVFGHTHYPTIELRAGINLYNSGDLVDSYSYLLQEDSKIELKYF